MASSVNGWPASENKSSIDVVDVTLNLSEESFTIGLARQAMDPLIELILWFDANIEPITSLYGHNYREIRGYEGSGKLSNHASGTAVDINASKHPLGSRNTFPDDQMAAIRAKVSELGLKWGGDYRNRADEHHFEIYTEPDESVWQATAGSLTKRATGEGFNYWWLVVAAAAASSGAIIYWYFYLREDDG